MKVELIKFSDEYFLVVNVGSRSMRIRISDEEALVFSGIIDGNNRDQMANDSALEGKIANLEQLLSEEVELLNGYKKDAINNGKYKRYYNMQFAMRHGKECRGMRL